MEFIDQRKQLIALGDNHPMGAGSLKAFIRRGHCASDLIVDMDFDEGKVIVQNSLQGTLTGVAVNGGIVWLDAPELIIDLRFNEKEEEDE